jgi:hypothetical protein
MQFVSYRRRGDLKIYALGDDAKSYHFINAETAAEWMKTNTTNIPTLASISPVSAAAGAADLTVTLTGTNFSAACEVLVNGALYASTFVSPTSITILAKPLLIPQNTVYNVAVRKGLITTVSKPFTFT